MKRNLKMLSAVAALAIFATACSKNGPGNDDNIANGEKGKVQLVISTEAVNSGLVRAAEESTEANPNEISVDPAKGLTVVVFNEDGSYNNAKQMILVPDGTNKYKTSDFIDVTAGNLFYFVFANNGTAGEIDLPAAGTDIETFMTKVVNVTYDASDVLSIAESNNFLLGSLWRQKTLTAAGGTTDVPTLVTVPSIGRLSSKIQMGDIEYDVTGELQGTFSGAFYRPGSVAKYINYAGVHVPNAATPLWNAAELPYGTNTDVLVISAVHEKGEGTVALPNTTDFFLNTEFDFVDADGTGTPFYITENTTARNADTGLQYYGNTSYIQIQTTYTPVYEEMSDVDGTTFTAAAGTGAFTGSAFYTGVVDGERYMFTSDPAAVEGISDIKTYEGGINYHKFPVFDVEETNDLMKNRVLRNHFYTFAITGFNDLGEPTEEVDPTDPIITTTTVQVEVSVKGWDKVAEGEVEL